ncbi:MAG TPA: hypothetical protein VFW66_08430 [Gemmatimonadales bacterium]|nr:hypothetical protein [Gemmatimonadales bacterium]
MTARKLQPRERWLRYLNRLSAGGRSNMYGAVPYLAAAFGLDRQTAFQLVCEWVDAHQPAADSTPTPPKSRGVDAPATATVAASRPARKAGVKRKRPRVRRAA